MRYPRVRNRLSIIEPYIKNKSVLDIGCVDFRPGNVRKYESTGLHKFLKEHSAELIGVDLDSEGAAEMTKSGYNVIAGNAEDMDLDRQFDCIVAGEVIEHLNNAGDFIATMRKHLKDDGILIVTTPNAFCIKHFFNIARRNKISVHAHHTCWYDPLTLSQLVDRYDMEATSIFFANKSKWYRKKYFYKIFRYQIPKFITWLRPYYSGTIIGVIKKTTSGKTI